MLSKLNIYLILYYRSNVDSQIISQVWKLPEPGDHCKPAGEVQVDMELHTCVTIFVDVALFVLPIWVINAKMMKSSKKYKVMLVFSVGLLAVIAAIVRLIYICTYDFYADPYVLTWHNPDSNQC